MIFPEKWAARWIEAWNAIQLDDLMELYADDIRLRSPFAKVYAGQGEIIGKAALRSYWSEVMRRTPNIRLELIGVYSGHLALTLHYRDGNGRNCCETVLFNDRDLATYETACLDRLR